MITQARLKELFTYNPSTGLFTRVTGIAQTKKGDIAGSIKHDGYKLVRIDGVSYRCSRLAFLYMEGEFPRFFVDHLNHNRFDDRWVNLRKVSRKENARNLSVNPRNKSGVTGVAFNKNRGRWESYIGNTRKIQLGRYIDFFEAVCARKSAENRLNYHDNHGKTYG